MFAIALLPLLSFVGVAVDYARASNVRTAMQSALDSAALMVSKDIASGTISSSDLSSKAQAYFNALFTSSDAANISVTAAYGNSGTSGQTITMTGSGTVTTQFMKVVGYPSLGINTNSTTTWGATKLRVAMVLDNTFSMTFYNKMTSMQSAAKNLVDQLSKLSQNNGDVMISIVPFNNYVNLGPNFQNASYIDWSYYLIKWNWNGCITDRNQDYDVQVTPPTIPASYYTALQLYPCPQQIVPLSTNWTSLKATIDAMTPWGTTDQPIGMVWGWQTLKQTIPMNAPPEDPNYTYKKVIILLSDGLNTENRWSAIQSTIDDRQKLLCNNIKADGVTIYAIQVNTDGDPTSSVMSYCASGSDNFFMLTSASQISSTFNMITTSLSKLRIAN